MQKLRYLTAGESHGKALVCVIEGMPSHLPLSSRDIDPDLKRRQGGYGRGGRMKIEADGVSILSGVRGGKTLGSPLTLLIENRDWVNWQDVMDPEKQRGSARTVVTRPRPGHADLAGALKYDHRDVRNVLERSSARETAARVAAGAVAKKFLSQLDIRIISYVTEIGGVRIGRGLSRSETEDDSFFLHLFEKAEQSPVRCPDRETEKKILTRIGRAMKNGDSLGGIFQVMALGVPPGLGSYSQWDRKLDARLAGALMSIQAMKGVELGMGFEMSRHRGSEVMDEIHFRARGAARSRQARKDRAGFFRKTNNAGGIEGGVSNGMPLVARVAMKPIPTLRQPLSTVDIVTKKTLQAAYERSDFCAVPAAAVIGEAVTALTIADACLEKFGGDSMAEVKRNHRGYLRQVSRF